MRPANFARDVHYSLEDGKFWISEYKDVGQGPLLDAAVFGNLNAASILVF